MRKLKDERRMGATERLVSTTCFVVIGTSVAICLYASIVIAGWILFG